MAPVIWFDAAVPYQGGLCRAIWEWIISFIPFSSAKSTIVFRSLVIRTRSSAAAQARTSG